MLLVLLFLLCRATAATACLQCDPHIVRLHEDIVLSMTSMADQLEMKKLTNSSFESFLQVSQARKGVIDPTTLYRVTTEYESEMDRYLKSEEWSKNKWWAIDQIFKRGKVILEEHMDHLIRDGLCPNKCGLLKRRVTDCNSCQFKLHICSPPSGKKDCGEHPVKAEERGQAVLDCFLPWHPLILGNPEYHYTWAPGVPRTKKLVANDFKVLIVTDESSVVLNQLHATEQGTYRCSLQDKNGTIYYQVVFLLTVAPSPPIQRFRSSLPSLFHGGYFLPFWRSDDQLLLIIAVVTILSLTASAGLVRILRKMKKKIRALKGQGSIMSSEITV